MADSVRVRFAPSPTGFLHLGGARTALYNWLWARHERGKFLLRVEDTDRKRSTEESAAAIVDGLRWLGIDWDEPIVFQSERFDLYKKHADELLAKGVAYRCFCLPEDIERKRERAQKEGRKPKYDRSCRDRPDAPPDVPWVLRAKMPLTGEVTVHDLIKGEVTVLADDLDDIVLLRADGSPTFHFSNVIDDHDMRVSHVIRGEDHLSNTFRHLVLYEAFGWEPPAFAHLPLIAGLSKRLGSASVQQYREEGYLPEAVVNYIVRLGWGHGDDEVFTKDDLIQKFRIEDVGKSPGKVNPDKLLWLDQHWIKTLGQREIAERLAPFLKKRGLDVAVDDKLVAVVRLLRERAKTLVEMAEHGAFFYVEELQLDDKARAMVDGADKALLRDYVARLGAFGDFRAEALEADARRFAEERKVALKDLAQPVRAALTGSTVSPPLFQTEEVLGKDLALSRLHRAFG